MEVFDKYSKEIIGTIDFELWESINSKIETAHKRFQTYRHSSHIERVQYIQIIVDALIENKDHLATLIAKEAGKPLFYAINELERCIRTAQLGVAYFEILEVQNVNIDFSGTPHSKGTTKRFPIGVIFGIAPFNFPLNLALHKIIPALASGNCIIVKPSPYTPLSLTFLMNKINEKLPKGLVQMVNCSNELAEKIVLHETIKMISFTGSAAVGWHIKSLVPKKKVTLELGGNAAVFVDDKTDFTSIAEKVANGCFLYAGQICISTQRIYVHENSYENFKKALIESTSKITSGNPLENHINSSLIDAIHLERMENWVEEAKQKGATILIGGKVLDKERNIFAPTLLENVNSSIKVYSEEVFGPIATLTKVKDYSTAISQINDSKYGLQVGIFTNDEKVISDCFDKIEVGGVIINNIPGFRKDEMPYGGIKDSGFGREGIAYAIKDMTELKLLVR
jgi:acyl-CoA reductase-like NAD-dependent aldehyde dehydrogenase